MGRGDRWIRGPAADGALAVSWVPFAVAAHLVEGGTGALRALFGAVMFVSFAHQPLTLPLVYASPWRMRTHRRLFLCFPLVAVVVIAAATRVSMTLVAVVGGLWNSEHILMQRYGIGRIYGRRAGDGQGRVEKAMLVAWFLVPLLWVTASGRLGRVLDRMSSGSVDAAAARVLSRLGGEARVGLVLAGAAAVFLTARWVTGETAAGDAASPGKRLYLASTAALFATAVIDPVAAVVGFVASHSIEYFVLVGRSVGSESPHPGPLGWVARHRHGRSAFFGVYAFMAAGGFVLLYRLASPGVLLVSVLSIGAVHFFYDAFIWKLRKPEVAASLAVVRG